MTIGEADNADRCPGCHEFWEHCDCEPAIVTALEDGVCLACEKPIKWGDLIQTWDEGQAHLACPEAQA